MKTSPDELICLVIIGWFATQWLGEADLRTACDKTVNDYKRGIESRK